MQSLILDISPLMEESTGAREVYSFGMPLRFEGLNLASDTTGRVEIMKIGNGFNANILTLKAPVEINCQKCLKKITRDVLVEKVERQFLLDPPAQIEDENDIYLVNKKDLTIDLGEFIRQEIILHFPLIPVCSKSCKGLCPICGKNKNETDCDCKEEKPEEYKPLAALKDLIKKR